MFIGIGAFIRIYVVWLALEYYLVKYILSVNIFLQINLDNAAGTGSGEVDSHVEGIYHTSV